MVSVRGLQVISWIEQSFRLGLVTWLFSDHFVIDMMTPLKLSCSLQLPYNLNVSLVQFTPHVEFVRTSR